MPRLPRLSGKEGIKVLERAGVEVFDQTGSHLYLLHGKKILKLKTLKNIIEKAGLSVNEFISLFYRKF